MSANGDLVVAEAQRGVGTQENSKGLAPPYTNSIGAQAWCGAFVDYVYKTAISVDLHKYTSNPYYVSTCWADFQSGGYILDVSQALPGDICFFNWGGKGRMDHMGIVKSRVDHDTLITIEGNSSDSVMEQERSVSGGLNTVGRIPELADQSGTGGPFDPPDELPPPVGMDYGLYMYGLDERGEEIRIFEGGLQYADDYSNVGWTTWIHRGAGTKIQIWTQRGNYSLDLVSVFWDFAGRPNKD